MTVGTRYGAASGLLRAHVGEDSRLGLALRQPPWAMQLSLFRRICQLGRGALPVLLSQWLLALHCRHSLAPRGPRWTPSSQIPPSPHWPRTRRPSFPPALLLPFPWTPEFLMSSAPRSWLVITSTFPSSLRPLSSSSRNSLFPSPEAPLTPPSACHRPCPRMRSCHLINCTCPLHLPVAAGKPPMCC